MKFNQIRIQLAALGAVMLGAGTTLGQGTVPPQTPPLPGAAGGADQMPKGVPPIRVVGPGTQEVGTVSPLEIYKGQFKFRNESSQPLTIEKVDAGCRCTYASFKDKVIPPNADTIMTYEVDVRGTVGPLDKSIVIKCAGFATPVQVRVHGELQYAVRVDPPPPKVTAGPGGVVEFNLKSGDGSPFKVLSVGGEPPEIVSQSPEGADKALSYTLRYNLYKFKPYALVVETDHPKSPVLDLRFSDGVIAELEKPYFQAWGDVAIGRHMVNLGVLKPGASVEFDVPITRSKLYDKPVEVRTDGGKVKLDLIGTESMPRIDDTRLKIKATFTEMARGMQLFPVYVTTDGKTNRTWACAVVK